MSADPTSTSSETSRVPPSRRRERPACERRREGGAKRRDVAPEENPARRAAKGSEVARGAESKPSRPTLRPQWRPCLHRWPRTLWPTSTEDMEPETTRVHAERPQPRLVMLNRRALLGSANFASRGTRCPVPGRPVSRIGGGELANRLGISLRRTASRSVELPHLRPLEGEAAAAGGERVAAPSSGRIGRTARSRPPSASSR